MRCGPEDVDKVYRIVSHPGVYKDFTDSLPDNYYELLKDILSFPHIYILMPIESSVFIFVPEGQIAYKCHSNILPESRGKEGFKAGMAACDWIFMHTGCLKLIGFTPTFCKGAHVFNRILGFKKEGVLTSSTIYNGMLYDLIIYGLTKGQWEEKKKR